MQATDLHPSAGRRLPPALRPQDSTYQIGM